MVRISLSLPEEISGLHLGVGLLLAVEECLPCWTTRSYRICVLHPLLSLDSGDKHLLEVEIGAGHPWYLWLAIILLLLGRLLGLLALLGTLGY